MAQIIIVASFPRSGTHFTIDVLRNAFPALRARKKYLEPNAYVYGDLDRLLQAERRFLYRLESILNKRGGLLFKTHKYAGGDIFFKGDLPHFIPFIKKHFPMAEIKVVYVERDLIATLRSYFAFYRSALRGSSELEEFLFDDSGAVDSVLEHRKGWAQYSATPILSISYEGLRDDPLKTSIELSGFLGMQEDLHFSMPSALKSVGQSRFNQIFCRDPPATTILGGGTSSVKFSDSIVARIRDLENASQ